ncbi:MAG: oligosaccharide flippase family protein, partial [Chitinophagales bacterium]|nr:oligosaccharide flippase family protein [Chitinophagales bacterium]
MRKKFATNLLFLFAVNLLIKPYWIFAIDRVVQNKVGPETYGTYFAVFNVSYIFSILLDFGINNFNNRAVSRNNKRLGEYVLNLMLLKLFLSIAYFALTFVYALSTGMNEMQMQMLLFLAINQLLLSAILY